MKKTRGLVIVFLMLALAASSAILASCGGQGAAQQSSSSDKETVSVKSEPVEQAPPIELKTEPFYVLLIGNDSRIGTVEINKADYEDGKGRSDTMMAVRVDPKTYQLTLLTIPRDTGTEISGSLRKLNETFYYDGVEGLEDAIKQLTGVTFDHYLMTKFGSFQDLINDLGGLAIDVKADMGMQDIVTGDWVEFPAGWYDALNGAQTLIYARERHKLDPNGETYRQSNDRMIIETIIKQILSDPKTAHNLAQKLLANIETDWDEQELMAYVDDFIAHADQITFKSGSGPWQGDTDPSSGLWITYRDEDTWARLMDVVNEGGDPNDVVPTLSLYY